jgi:uncharacterized membrane protein (DUF2068 family)
MRPLLSGAAFVARVGCRAAAISVLIGGIVFPFTPDGYFALLPILTGITVWLLSDFASWLPPGHRLSNNDHDVPKRQGSVRVARAVDQSTNRSTAFPTGSRTAFTRPDRSLRAIALFEALKGVLVVGAALGVLALLHTDMQHFAVELVELLHLDQEGRWALRLITVFGRLEALHPATLVAAAAAYAVVRCVEAYGLWHARAWAEWFAIISGGLYIPFELKHLIGGHQVAIALVALAVNVAIVAVLLYAVWTRRHVKHSGNAISLG